MGLEINSNNYILNNKTSVDLQTQPSLSITKNHVNESDRKTASFVEEMPRFGNPTEESNITMEDIDALMIGEDMDSDESIDLIRMLFTIQVGEAAEKTQSAKEKIISTEFTKEEQHERIEGQHERIEGQYDHTESKKVISVATALYNPAIVLLPEQIPDNLMINPDSGEFFRSDRLDTFLEQNYGNIFFEGSNLPLAQNHDLIRKIKEKCQKCKPSEIKHKIAETVEDYMTTQDLYEIDADGNKKKLTSERRREIAEAIANEMHSYAAVYMQKQNELSQRSETGGKIIGTSSYREQSEHLAFPLLNGLKYDYQIRDRTYKILVLSSLMILNTKILDVKSEKEVSEKQLDLIERIKQLFIMKDILKREIQKCETEHFGIKIESKGKEDLKMDLSTQPIFNPPVKEIPHTGRAFIGLRRKMGILSAPVA